MLLLLFNPAMIKTSQYEFINPSIIGEQCPIQNGDAVFSINFRADRMRQIVTAINDSNFPHFQTESLDILFTTMTEYQKEFPYSVFI